MKKINLLRTFSIFFCFSLLFCIPAQAKVKKPVFQKTFKTLTLKKSVTLHVKNIPKQGFVRFFTSDTKKASVKKRKGKVTAKKVGKVKITAKIYNKKKKKIKTLNMKIRIISNKKNASVNQTSDGYLKNASFSLKENINPWNYTITLRANRILLKKEISESVLSLSPKGKTSPNLSAAFSSLSKNGKEVTYLLNQASRKKLCPRDGSMDGEYTIRSNSFSGQLTTTYAERLNGEDISGFVLDLKGTPLTNTFITYKTSEMKTSVYTDPTGHYRVKASGVPVSLSAEKTGYQTEILTSLNPAKTGTLCENFILKPSSEKDFSFDFTVLNEDKKPVADASVFCLAKEKAALVSAKDDLSEEHLLQDQAAFSGKTDKTGSITFTNGEQEKTAYTKIALYHDYRITLLNSSNPSISNICNLPKNFSPGKEYLLYIFKNEKEDFGFYKSCKLTFSPSSFYTNHFAFEIILGKEKDLISSGITFKTEDMMTELPDTLHFDFYQHDKKEAILQYDIDYIKTVKKSSNAFSVNRLPFSFSDGIYYLKTFGKTGNGNIICLSKLTKIVVKNGMVTPVSIPLKKITYSRFLTVWTGKTPGFEKISFNIYQKTKNGYFYLEKISSDTFMQTASGVFAANIFLHTLIAEENYLFLPERTDISLSDYLPITLPAEKLYTTKEEAETAPPFAKTTCTSDENKEKPLPDDFDDPFICLYPDYSMEITKNLVRLSSSYPNTILAMYQKNGSFISTTLLPKIDRDTAYIGTSDTIIDIYINGELLVTNQAEYL